MYHFHVSETSKSLTLPRLIEVLSVKKPQPELPHDAKEKYDAFLRILTVRLGSTLLKRLLISHNRR